MIQDCSTAEYRCPGETYGISRAVHLGRLAAFHAACRHCPRRDDVAGLSARQIRHLGEAASRAGHAPLFRAEGVGEAAINDLGPDVARMIAIEFSRRLASPAVPQPRGPAVVVAGDGRLATAAIIAATVEGVRWTGCEAIDIGAASAPCMARASEHLAADGGIFVGNADGGPHSVALKFWAHGEPLSRGGLLDEVAASLPGTPATAMIDRPRRSFGALRRFAAEEVYLGDLRSAYHALRPLRFVLSCTTGPVVACLKELIRNVECRIIPATTGSPWGEQVAAAGAHFGMHIGDDGENCHVVDERGRPVEADRLLALIVRSYAGPAIRGADLRQQTFRHMKESRAAIAADAAGRLWYAAGHAPLPDALQTLTRLLVLLSRNDLAFSIVLDRQR